MKSTVLIANLRKHQADFQLVVPFFAEKDNLIQIDFTEKNKELNDGLLSDTRKFTDYINRELQKNQARYGIGGYGELRNVYNRSKVFDAVKDGEEPRRLHLGTDIWGKPHTPVMAPLDGIVHSFAFNNNFGDYGTTIILTHLLDDLSFFTLFGHLALNSIKNMEAGDRIEKGDVFAEFGIPVENGHWPPHLHFQLIMDLQGWEGDYPGVCKYSEKEQWLANCPDPDIVLKLDQYIMK